MRERLVPVLVAGLLLLGIPVASRSSMLAAAITALAALILVLAILGLDRTSVCVMVAAFALAPCVKFVVPGFRFFNISDVLFLVAIGLALPRLATRRMWLPLAFVIASMAFVTISLLASLRSSSPSESYYYAARVILTFIGIPALLVWWAPRGRRLVALMLAFAAGTGVSVLVGLTQAGGGRSFGLTGHPNVMGYTAMLTMALLPFLVKALPKPHRTWICAIVFGIAAVGVWTSGSRAALVTTVILLALFPAAERSILAALGVLSAGVVAILVVGQARGGDGEGQDALSRLLGEGDVEGANRARIEGVKNIWELILQHPLLGSGFKFDDFLGHNAYLQIAAAAGFLGLAAFVLVCVPMVTPLVAYDDIHSRLVYPMVVFLVAAPVSPNLTDRYIGFLLGLSLVGVVAVHEARRNLQLDGLAPIQTPGPGQVGSLRGSPPAIP